MTQQVASKVEHETTYAKPEPSEWERLMQQDVKMKTEYTPFLGTEKITLSPGIVVKYLCRPTKAGHICSDEQAVRFIMLCKARGLNPWEGDAFLIGYDTSNGPEFNLVTAHQAFLKRAEAHAAFDGMESGVVVKNNATDEVIDLQGDYVPEDCTLMGGWSKVHRRDRKIPAYRRLELKTFRKNFGVWLSNAAGMIVKCAEADGLRSSFPNSVGGMYMQEELPSSETPSVEPATRKEETAKAIKEAAPATPSDAPAGRRGRPKSQTPTADAQAQRTGAEPPSSVQPSADNTTPGDAGLGPIDPQQPACPAQSTGAVSGSPARESRPDAAPASIPSPLPSAAAPSNAEGTREADKPMTRAEARTKSLAIASANSKEQNAAYVVEAAGSPPDSPLRQAYVKARAVQKSKLGDRGIVDLISGEIEGLAAAVYFYTIEPK